MSWKPDYVTAAALATYVRAAADDAYVGELGTAAARAVDAFCNRQFGKLEAPETWTYDPYRAARLMDGTWLLPIDDVQDPTGLVVTVDGTAVAVGADGYRLWPRNATAQGHPYTALRLTDRPLGDVDVTATFGWNAVPAAVISAVRFQVNRWYVRRDSPYGTAGSPAEGTEIRLGAVLDPDTRAILAGGRVVRKQLPR